jgi:hypothetical protein
VVALGAVLHQAPRGAHLPAHERRKRVLEELFGRLPATNSDGTDLGGLLKHATQRHEPSRDVDR